MNEVMKGGCQCGAVRFEVTGPLTHTSICHCRMCQKAFGNAFAPLTSVRNTDFRWTTAEPARFQSSNFVKRGFCSRCGTPLTYEEPGGMSIATGAFDHPQALAPSIQWGIEARLPWMDGLDALPGKTSLEDAQDAPFLLELVSYQYADED